MAVMQLEQPSTKPAAAAIEKQDKPVRPVAAIEKPLEKPAAVLPAGMARDDVQALLTLGGILTGIFLVALILTLGALLLGT